MFDNTNIQFPWYDMFCLGNSLKLSVEQFASEVTKYSLYLVSTLKELHENQASAITKEIWICNAPRESCSIKDHQ